MHPDMARWIDAAANNGFDLATKNHLSEVFMTDLRDPIVKVTIQAFLQAAAADGVKLKPRKMTPAMKDAYRGTAIDPEVEWEPVFDAAPDYLGGD
jgi:hypothetical protein